MDKLCKTKQCTGCGACASVCPRSCIEMQPDAEGFLRPVVQTDRCVDCDHCRQACPILAEHSAIENDTVAYAAINTEEGVRRSSTSGGVFTLLCRWVLEHGGVVFGAAYDENFAVVHCKAEHEADLHKLRTAKYAQSALGDSFKQVETCLKEGRYVLFSGTPCQIGGLVSYLGGKSDNLILVDLICHGVPSPKVWEHYVEYRGDIDSSGERPVAINLRSKKTGWPAYSVQFDYAGGLSYSALNSQDPYLRGFVANLYLRPSCYDCYYKGSGRQSDFTLGDYWGVWSQLPDYNDGKGTSLVLLHTKKAKELWQQLSLQIQCTMVDVKKALADNPSALVSSQMTEKRELFFAHYQKEDFKTCIEELLPQQMNSEQKQSFLHRIFRKVRCMLRV